jgi:hypothetical protein
LGIRIKKAIRVELKGYKAHRPQAKFFDFASLDHQIQFFLILQVYRDFFQISEILSCEN